MNARVQRHPHRAAGLTLVELLTTVAVAIVLIAATVPNYLSMTRKNEVVSGVNALIAEVQYARSEALKRGRPVSLCPALQDAAGCNTAAAPWSPAVSPQRLVFVDEDGDGTLDAGVDELLKRVSGGPAAVTITLADPVPDPKFLGFTPKGLLSDTTASLTFSDGGATQRCVTLNLTGRSSIANGGCP